MELIKINPNKVEIRLMSLSEAQHTERELLKYDSEWWLAYGGDESEGTVSTVSRNGSIDETGSNPCNPMNDFAVRPILFVDYDDMGNVPRNKAHNTFVRGSEVEFFGKKWALVIQDNSYHRAGFLLMDKPLAKMAFNDRSKDGTPAGRKYEGSDIQKFLDGWLATVTTSGTSTRKNEAMKNNRQFLKKKINEERNNYGNKGPWWYFTLHGLGPGMIPKDVHVVDSVEGVNKKGTRGLFIALDGVLTWDELKKYDLIELAPPKAMRECKQLKEAWRNTDGSDMHYWLDDDTFVYEIGKYTDKDGDDYFVVVEHHLADDEFVFENVYEDDHFITPRTQLSDEDKEEIKEVMRNLEKSSGRVGESKCNEAREYPKGVQYVYTFEDGSNIKAGSEDEAIKKWERRFENRNADGEARDTEELVKIAQGIYDDNNYDDDRWFDFNDKELATLWSRCIITQENPWGEAFDDELYETITSLPSEKTRKIFDMSDKMVAEKKTMGESLSLSKRLTEAKEDDFYFRAFITNLGKYNEGFLEGEWVDFPIEKTEFDGILKRHEIGEGEYEEWFVTDYESNLPGFNWQELGEYAGYDKLQEFGEKIDEINKSGQSKAIANAYEVTGDIQEAIDGIENGDIIFYDGISTDYDLGDVIITDVYNGEIPDELAERYFDYEGLGRDIRLEYYQEDDDMPETAGEYWCGDENASDYDIGEAFVNEVGIGDQDFHFDYEAFGRDLGFENFTFTKDGVIEMV